MAKEKELTSQETAKLRRREREVEDRLGDNLYHGSNLMLALLAVPEVDRVRILEIFSRELVPESLAEIGEYLASKKKEPDIIEGLLLDFVKKTLGISLGKLTPEQSRLLGETAREITDSFL